MDSEQIKSEYQIYDIGIIGAGIAGLNAAIHARKNGLSVVLFETRDLGGLSLNGGDLLIGELYNALKAYKNATRIIKDPSHLPPFDLQRVFTKMTKIKRNFLREYFRIFDDLHHINFVNNKAEIITPNIIRSNKKDYQVRNIIIAAGSKTPNYTIPRKESSDVLTNVLKVNQLMRLEKTPENLVIVGGSNIAFEIATFFSQIGTKTTILARGDILRAVDEDIKEEYLRVIKNGNLIIYRNAQVTDVTNSAVTFSYEGEEITIPCDTFIPAIGFETLHVKVGDEEIPSDDQGIIVNEYCQTKVPGIYAIGDSNFYEKFTNRAIGDAFTAVNHILGRKKRIEQNYVRHITGIYEYATYGKNEARLREEHIPYIAKTFYPSSINDVNVITMYKVLLHQYTHEVLGLFMVGTNLNEQMNTSLMVLDDSNRLDYISRSQVLSIAYLVAKALGDLIKELDLARIETNLTSYFQPKYDLTTNKIVGAESLARFYIDGRFHNPMSFVTNYEKRGHIYEMDLKVLHNACRFLCELKKETPLCEDFVVAVNIAPYTLTEVTPENIYSIVLRYNLKPEQIMLEVTERNFERGVDFIASLASLHDMGFKVSMDDFSVGNSSIALLKVYDFDEIKLDMSLLPVDENDVSNQAIYQNIIRALSVRNAKLIAEGIETPYHLQFLKNLGVKYGQGYLLGKPMAKDDFIKLYKQTK